MSALAALAWLPPAVLGLAVSAAWNRKGTTWAWSRALRGARAAAAVVGVLWLLTRLFDWLANGQGPMSWVGVSQPSGTDPAPLVRAVALLALAAGTCFAVGVVVAGQVAGPRTARPRLAIVAAALALLAAVLVIGAFASSPLAYATVVGLDLVAVTPVMAVGCAATLFVKDVAVAAIATSALPSAAAPPSVAAATAPGVDPESVLRQVLHLGQSPAAYEEAAYGPPTAEPQDDVDRLWVATGGLAGAPGALRQALKRLAAPGPGMIVADLSAPTEEAFITSLVTTALLGRAARVLIVVDDPTAARDRVIAAQDTVGAWASGPMVARATELRDALARGTLPALVALSLGDLSTVIGAKTPTGSAWLDHLDLIVLARVDQLPPIEATHMAFTLRRLGLALDERRARPTWLAVGQSTLGSLRYLEEATLSPFEFLPLAALARTGVRIHVRSAANASTELEAAENALTGFDVHLEDATGELSDPARRQVTKGPGYHGQVSLAMIDECHVASTFRARKGLAHHLKGANAALSVWWVPETPLSRFLLRPGVLRTLEAKDELASPRPVAGLGNRFLAAAHLEAALHEGRPDEHGLRRAFGDSAVDALLGARKNVHADGHRARWDRGGGQVDRSPVLGAPGSAWVDPGRETITANVVEIRSSVGHKVLRRVDRRLAATRFYPRRIFRAEGILQQVEGSPLAPGANHLQVSPAPAGARPTDPLLRLEITAAHWLGVPAQHRIDTLTFARVLASVEVREQVFGAIPRGEATPSDRFAPVTAEYPTTAMIVLFPASPSPDALRHAGQLAADLLPAHLLVRREDVDVIEFPDGLLNVSHPALAFVDRHVGGIGMAESLDAQTISNLFRWTWGVLSRCACMDGCKACSPASVLAGRPNKVGALKLLGG